MGVPDSGQGPQSVKEPEASAEMSGNWTANPELLQRARVTLVVSLSRCSPDELVRILMDWLDDEDLEAFCRAYLDEGDIEWILRGAA